MLSDQHIKILMLFHELEESLGIMYMQFAEKFPAYNHLWQRLIQEEGEHAGAVQKLYQLTYKKQSRFDAGNIRAEGVQSIIDFIKTAIDAAQRGAFTELQALTIAHDVEKSLIERSFFDHFNVSLEFAALLKKLRVGSMAHIALTKKELDTYLREHKKQ